MTWEDQIITIKDFCDEILYAEGMKQMYALKKYLWKIEAIARDLRLCMESGDLDPTPM